MQLHKYLAAAVLLACAGMSSAADIFVSPTGADANAGTADKPLQTLAAAQKAARAAKAGGPVTITLQAGTYYLPETLVLTPEDSGTKEAPLTWQAAAGQTVVVSGGQKLDLKWEPYKDGIMQAKVPAGLQTDQLFINGTRQILARYPNFDPNERIFNGFAADAFSPARVKRWADPTGGFIHAMHRSEWGGFHFIITGKKDDGTLTYEGGWQNNRPAGLHPQHRFVENIFEELDAPGEWFLNTKTSTLYFYPPAGTDLAKATVEVVRLRHLVECRGSNTAPVRGITIKGITFRHATRTFMENKEPLVRSDWTTYRGGAIFYTGTEDCLLEDCFIDQVGGNAVFVNNYNRRLTVRGCHIARAGGNGVAFVGDRDAARVPRDWNDHSQTLANLDRTPGPKTDNYPAACLVDDCLIYQTGRVEKQTAPVQIELAQGITVRHCSIYDVPRAGINIGDGCWGGHVIEFCDIFDTVKETGDHGSFNSWGRDRFWGLKGLDLNSDAGFAANKEVPLLDAVQTTVMHDNRWRCDHGWDIDLDDGSSNYHIYNNLCLNGGLKNREGFGRVVENNIMVNNTFHPHVWFKHSGDIFRRNIVFTNYRPIGVPTPWGAEVDNNLHHQAGAKGTTSAAELQNASKRDEHSVVADAMFMDPAKGDYRVKDGSPALALGFKNFPMDQYGVQKAELKALARTPELPGESSAPQEEAAAGPKAELPRVALGAPVRNIAGLGDRSVYGLADESGVVLLDVGSAAAQAGLQKDDVILSCNGKPVRTVADLLALQNEAAGGKLSLSVSRKQAPQTITLTDYVYSVVENAATPEFKTVPLSAAALPAHASVGPRGIHTANDPVKVLTDGKVVEGYGPVVPNGVHDGMYKLDLGTSVSIAQVNSFSANIGGHRGRQHFVLYGSNATKDPGWKIADPAFVPLAEVDTKTPVTAFAATSIRRSDGKSLGTYRWLVWAIAPVTTAGGGENTAFQELQAIPETAGK